LSSIARWANQQLLTIWRAGARDKYGNMSYGDAEHCWCSYRIGGSDSYTDKMGVEFMPKTIYWTELLSEDKTTFLDAPTFGDKILLGQHTTLEDDAADIKSITIDDASMFGSTEMPDYVLGV
jgi:hypothetical protein